MSPEKLERIERLEDCGVIIYRGEKSTQPSQELSVELLSQLHSICNPDDIELTIADFESIIAKIQLRLSYEN